VWSFSGDSSEVGDLFGSVAGQVSSVGSLIGSVGFVGSVSGGCVSGGRVAGRGKTIEQDDLEILELLDLL
jgi:hypothetical protein